MAKLGGVTHSTKPSKKPEGMRKDRIALGRISQIVRLDGIRFDDSI